MLEKWDRRFMELARHVAQWSKDPSTQVGSVIVQADHKVAGLGYNGFPRGISDDEDRLADRPTKYRLTVHAEANAILNARGETRDATIYVWPLPPCGECAKLIIQAGIRRVVSPADESGRWTEDCERARAMMREAGLEIIEVRTR